MSGLLDGMLGNLISNEVSNKISDQLGLENSKTQKVLTSALPILMKAISNKAETPNGESELKEVLEKHKSSDILENISGFLSKPNAEEEGSSLLDNILGAKRKNVEQHISEDSGISSGMVSKLLSIATPIIMSLLAKNNGDFGIGGIGGMLGNLMGSSKSTGDQNMIEKLLDKNDDGSVVDDVTKMGSSLLGKMFK